MFRKNLPHLIAIIILLTLLFLPGGRAAADIGPKPELDFEFILPEGLTIVDGELLVCQDDACTATEPLLEVGPQGITCQPTTCQGMIYGTNHPMRLQVTFSDGVTRLSNPFDVPSNQNVYTVEVRETDLLVERQSALSQVPAVLIALAMLPALCFGVVLLVGVLMIFRQRAKRKPA